MRADVILDSFRYGGDVVETILNRSKGRLARSGSDRSTPSPGTLRSLTDLEGLLSSLAGSLGVPSVLVADEAVTSQLGGLGDEPGTNVTAGTGIVGLGIGPAGAARVGSMVGDDASGWWIGRRGIIADLSSFDGRSGGSAALLIALERQYGPTGSFAAKLAAAPSPVGVVAAFAPAIADAARGAMSPRPGSSG